MKLNKVMEHKVNQMVSDMRGIATLDIEMAIAKELVRAGWVKTNNRCEDCAHQHAADCPNSKECYSTTDKPYFVKKK